jgi:hypothetical protein
MKLNGLNRCGQEIPKFSTVLACPFVAQPNNCYLDGRKCRRKKVSLVAVSCRVIVCGLGALFVAVCAVLRVCFFVCCLVAEKSIAINIVHRFCP